MPSISPKTSLVNPSHGIDFGKDSVKLLYLMLLLHTTMLLSYTTPVVVACYNLPWQVGDPPFSRRADGPRPHVAHETSALLAR